MMKKGFQWIEGDIPLGINERGYCQMWSLFFMETILLNPTLDTGAIIEACLNLGNYEPEYFRNLIRGYTLQLGEEVHEAFRSFLGDDFKFARPQDTEDMSQMLELIRQRLSWKKVVKELSQANPSENKYFPLKDFLDITMNVNDVKTCEDVSVYIHFLLKNELLDKKLFTYVERPETLTKLRKDLITLMVRHQFSFEKLHEAMLDKFYKMKSPQLITYMLFSETYPPKFIENELVKFPFDGEPYKHIFAVNENYFPPFFKKCCDAFRKGWVPSKTKPSLAEVEKNTIANPKSTDVALGLIFDFSAFMIEPWTIEQKNEVLHGELIRYDMTLKDMHSYLKFYEEMKEKFLFL
jgi:hypothetical protein